MTLRYHSCIKHHNIFNVYRCPCYPCRN